MEAAWPKVHRGEDNLYQCIRELRAALGDDERQMIKLISGRGYMYDAEVSTADLELRKRVEGIWATDGVGRDRANAAVCRHCRRRSPVRDYERATLRKRQHGK